LGPDLDFRHLFDSDYEYAEAVAAVRAAARENAPLDGLRMFVAVLARTLDNEQEVRGHEGPEELSYIWRKAIDDHAQNVHNGEVRDALIVAIRDLATATIEAEPTSGHDVLASWTAPIISCFGASPFTSSASVSFRMSSTYAPARCSTATRLTTRGSTGRCSCSSASASVS
jgi:hypothetical protein